MLANILQLGLNLSPTSGAAAPTANYYVQEDNTDKYLTEDDSGYYIQED